MGGFGSQSNYKSAAQEFADAWVDAFNEGGDALDALGGKFDDFFDNLIKKQLMQRGAKRYLEPILKAFDDAVSEGSAGGNNGYDVTKEELDTIAPFLFPTLLMLLCTKPTPGSAMEILLLKFQ